MEQIIMSRTPSQRVSVNSYPQPRKVTRIKRPSTAAVIEPPVCIPVTFCGGQAPPSGPASAERISANKWLFRNTKRGYLRDWSLNDSTARASPNEKASIRSSNYSSIAETQKYQESALSSADFSSAFGTWADPVLAQ